MLYPSVIFDTIFISCSAAAILMIWFESDAFTEYMKLLGGTKFFHIDKWEEAKEMEPSMPYHYHLLLTNPSFFIKLITCPLCLSLWLVVIICLLKGVLILVPISYILSILIYKQISFANEQ